MKKYFFNILLIICLFCFSACDDKSSAEEPSEADNTILTESDIDLSLLSDEDLEIFISILNEQGQSENFAVDTDNAITWQSGKTFNRFGGNWLSDWSPLPIYEGQALYQAFEEGVSYTVILKNCTLSDAQAYTDKLSTIGFSNNITSNHNADIFSWHGESSTAYVNVVFQNANSMLWIDYFLLDQSPNQ